MEELIINLDKLNNKTLRIAIILHEMQKGHRIIGDMPFSLFEITVLNEENIKNINSWNISNVTDMENLFRNTPDFDSDIRRWTTRVI